MATHPSRAKPPKPCNRCGRQPDIIEIREGFYVRCPGPCDEPITWPPTPHKYIAVRTWNARKS